MLSDRTAEADQNEDSPNDTESQTDEHPAAVPLDDREHITQPVVYDNFLRFLELGCGGSPSQGYPTLVVILSTIPNEVRSPRRRIACNNSLFDLRSYHAPEEVCDSCLFRYGQLSMVRHYLHYWKRNVERALLLS
jgi:hypothetical protein